MEPSSRVEFSAEVTHFAEGPPPEVTWYSPDVEVTDHSLISTSSRGLWLVVRAYALLPGKLYTFEVTATDSVATATANVTVVTNQAPVGGAFSVTPHLGEALKTPFLLRTSGWDDPEGDSPLGYMFCYTNSLGRSVILDDGMLSANANNSSTATVKLNGGNRSISVAVTDSFGASGRASGDVAVVSPSGVFDTVANASAEAASLLSQGREFQALALVAECAGALAGVSAVTDAAVLVRVQKTLLQIAWNASESMPIATDHNVALRAATLELIIGAAAQVR